MKLIKHKIGKYIELYSEPCNNPRLTVDEISGINRDKEFFEPSKQVGKDTSKYKIVPPKYFACNLMHIGRDEVLPIALNHTKHNKIVSPAYTVFQIKENDSILYEYFFLMLKSSERDRYFWFNTDASVRDGMSWNDFCDLEISLPSIAIQQKAVDLYNAMINNQNTFETGLEDLKQVCDAYIENLRTNHDPVSILNYIERVKELNNDLIKKVKGVSAGKGFIETIAKLGSVDLTKYQVVRENQFAYTPTRINIGSIALYKGDPCVISPFYVVFQIIKPELLIPEYLNMWLQRSEFHRFTLFKSDASIRQTFEFHQLEDVYIPVPSVEIQESIVNIYKCYMERKEINEKLKMLIKNICPILIKGSIEEAR